ncbi:uncharacterized protein METZ01_LOCUS284674, partial [marine metagenome]
MKFSKCVALFAATLVGFGVVASDAAMVTSVKILSPADSGALRGIDSTFSVEAKILDFTPADSLEVIFYLVTSNDSTVVADGVNTGARALASAIGKSIKTTTGVAQKIRTSSGLVLNSTAAGSSDDRSALRGSEGNLIAVRATRGKSLVSTASYLGDADSVTAKVTGDTTTFTWYGKVHHSSGTVNGIRAAAIAIDPTSPDTSLPKLSAGSLLINIDADRPVNPGSMVTNSSAAAGVSKIGTPNFTISGLANSAPNNVVLGINDSLKLDIKLGSATDAVLIGDSLSVIAEAFGKSYAVSKSARSSDTLKWRRVIAEGDYGDFVGTQDAPGSG